MASSAAVYQHCEGWHRPNASALRLGYERLEPKLLRARKLEPNGASGEIHTEQLRGLRSSATRTCLNLCLAYKLNVRNGVASSMQAHEHGRTRILFIRILIAANPVRGETIMDKYRSGLTIMSA